MDLLQIRLDCDQTTLYQNLKDKSGRIQCPACKDHTIDVEQCLSMLYNKELILRNKIELDLDKNLKDELMIKLDDQFDKVVNQIDLQCDILIKRIKDYTLDLINQLQMEKCELRMEIESMDTQEMSKESFVKEIFKEATLFKKLKIEKQFENKVNDQKKIFLHKMDECDYCLKVPDIQIHDLVGSLELSRNFHKAKSEIKPFDHVNDVLNLKGSALISLKSKISGGFVSEDNLCGSGLLKCRKTKADNSELFFLVKNKDNTVSLQSSEERLVENPKQNCYGLDHKLDPVIVKLEIFGERAKFCLINNQDGSYSFRSIRNKMLVYMSDVSESDNLIVKGYKIKHQHKFFIEVRN